MWSARQPAPADLTAGDATVGLHPLAHGQSHARLLVLLLVVGHVRGASPSTPARWTAPSPRHRAPVRPAPCPLVHHATKYPPHPLHVTLPMRCIHPCRWCNVPPRCPCRRAPPTPAQRCNPRLAAHQLAMEPKLGVCSSSCGIAVQCRAGRACIVAYVRSSSSRDGRAGRGRVGGGR